MVKVKGQNTSVPLFCSRAIHSIHINVCRLFILDKTTVIISLVIIVAAMNNTFLYIYILYIHSSIHDPDDKSAYLLEKE